MNCVFVILHYLTIKDTLEAVESLKKYEPGTQIIIVDNCSANGSLEKLLEQFRDDDGVDVVASPENVGFARGNNLGIAYAREHYLQDEAGSGHKNKHEGNYEREPCFICVMNNDVLLLESIMPVIQKEYESSHFAVLGPMIYTADGRCNDNPGADKPMSEEELQRDIGRLKRILGFERMHLGIVYRVLRKIKMKYLGEKENETHRQYLERVENVQLHGSFLVLSPRFFEYFPGLYAGTFLNMEEDILFWQLQKQDLKTVYLPEVHIFHKEDAASRTVWPSERKRALAKSQNCLDSAKAFLRLMKEDGDREARGEWTIR